MPNRTFKSSNATRGRRPRRGGDPAHIGPLLSDTRAEAARALRLGPVDLELWRRVVGPRIADRTRPGSVRRQTLTVTVASAVWAQELSLLSAEILARLGQAGVELGAIRFVVGKLGRAELGPVVPPPPPPRTALPRELRGRIEEIEDPELRAAIAEAASSSLALERATSAKRSVPALRSAASGNARSGPAGPARVATLPNSRAGRRG
jgi:hypothetical protein